MSVSIRDTARIPQERDKSVWEEMLRRMDRYSFFQTPRWPSILQRVIPELIPRHHWILFSDGKEAILPAFAIKKFFWLQKLDSLPWNTYGGLISSDSLSVDHLCTALRSFLFVSIPAFQVTLDPLDPLCEWDSFPSFLKVGSFTTQMLQLDHPFERLWEERFHKGNRRDIRQTRNKGVTVRWSNDRDAVEIIKYLYQLASDKWEGVATFPLSFFDALENISGDEVRIWIAEQNEKPLACALILYGKQEVQYLAAARDHRIGKLNPSKLLLSEIIKDACERNFLSINFGASAGLKGVERFKEVFGGEKVNYLKLRVFHPLFRIFPR